MILFNFLLRSVRSLEMPRANLFKFSQFVKTNSEGIKMNCVRNCEYLVAYKLRRGQQVLSLYKKLWGEVRLKQMINQLRQRLVKQFNNRKKMLMLAGTLAVFDWNKNRIDEKNMRSHYLDLDYINYLIKLTITCNVCGKRLVVDIRSPNVDYCSCSGSGSVNNKKFGSCPWMPFLERQDLLIWRKEQDHNPGYFEYKVYGFYNEVRADMFLQVQLDIENRKRWDVTAAEIKLLETDQFSNSDILYWEMQWPRFFANRDYVFNRRYIIDPVEKVIVIMNHVTEHPNAPESPKKYRVKDYKCTMVIKPETSFDRPGTRFCMTYYDNPGLSIPGPILTWVATTAMPDFLNRLRAASTKYPKSTEAFSHRQEPRSGVFRNITNAFRLRGSTQNSPWVSNFKSYVMSS